MELYGGLFESMMACCGRVGPRRAPLYTLAMVVLGLAVVLNVLSVVHLLWTLGVVDNPYRVDGDLRSQRYLFGALYLAFLINIVLARIKFHADRTVGRAGPRRLGASRNAAPLYVLGSALFFVLSLTVSLRTLA